MGAIVHLKTKPDRLRRDQAEELRQALLPFEEQMPGAVRELIGHIDRQTASRERWTFVMLSPEQNGAVVRHLVQHSKRPLVAVQLWAMCFEHLRHDTGEIMLTRKEIAEKLGQRPQEVSGIISELVDFGAIIRNPNVTIHYGPGVGMSRYFMNPRVATHLAGRERDDAQAEAPLLKLMEGGKVT
jgi:hypothetical protein